MDNTLTSGEIDIDYVLIVKDKDIILNEIDFTDNERLICSSIIDSLERQASKEILAGKCVSIPFLGTIEKNWYKSKVISHYKDFKEARGRLSKEEYKEYTRQVMQQEIKEHDAREAQAKKDKRFKRHVLPKYLKLVKSRGVAYANCWMATIKLLEVVEFDPEIEEVYERFGTGLDANN